MGIRKLLRGKTCHCSVLTELNLRQGLLFQTGSQHPITPFSVQWDFSEVKGRVVPQWPTRIAAKEVGTSRRDRNVAEGEGRETDCGRIGITKVVSEENCCTNGLNYG